MKNNPRQNLIDGLPNTYDVTYVTKTNKHCELCSKVCTELEIHSNQIICSENFEFYHKNCLINMNMTYKHSKPEDLSSVIFIEKTAKEEQISPLD